jgi:hypothetical protein
MVRVRIRVRVMWAAHLKSAARGKILPNEGFTSLLECAQQ